MYEKMYHKLFNTISDALDLMEEQKFEKAFYLLEGATKETEEMYISQ